MSLELAADEPLIDAAELSRRLVSYKGDLYRDAKAGLIPCIRWGRKVRFRYSDVLAALQRRAWSSDNGGSATNNGG